MFNKKHVLGLATASIFVSGSAFSTTETSEATIFSATVESQCGVSAADVYGALAFGDDYNYESHATVNIISNSENGIRIRATHIDHSSLPGDLVQKENIFIKSTGTTSENKDLSQWEGDGVFITRDQIQTEDDLKLFARVNVDESQLDANEIYEVQTTWTIECNG